MAAFDSSAVEILGVGNPLLDISTVVPESVLDKYGVKVRGEKKTTPRRALSLRRDKNPPPRVRIPSARAAR